jgi:GDP-L-fucose synthase
MADTPFSLAGRRVYVAGHRGMAGSAIARRLAQEGCEIVAASRSELDLRRQADVEAWMARQKPSVVVIAAATVGGIIANSTRPAEFLYDNLAIETNVIHAAQKLGVAKLMFLGSSCMYPPTAPQPISESSMLTAPLEVTNEWYAVAKIAGAKLCEAYRKQHGCDFITVVPTGLYGPGDRYDATQSHVIPALLMKFHAAKMARKPTVDAWGTGSPRREFLHADDMADAAVFLLQTYSEPGPINIGDGKEVTIRELTMMIAEITGYDGQVVFDPSKPDGVPRKALDSSRLVGMGWRAKIGLRDGLAEAYRWYIDNVADKAR